MLLRSGYDTIVDSLAWVNRVTDILEDDVDGYDDDAESGVILELINLRTEQYLGSNLNYQSIIPSNPCGLSTFI